jgi:hypothetical protein
MGSEERRQVAEQEFQRAVSALVHLLSQDVSSCLRKVERGFPGTDDPPELSMNAHISRLDDAINSVLQSSGVRKTESKRVKGVVIQWFRASYPFSRLFLKVAKSSASVYSHTLRTLVLISQVPLLNPYGLVCAGLISLLDVYTHHHFCVGC